MAEAAPPRKTTTYNRFSTMASQNERYNTKEDEMFWLENIMRTAPHKLHSVPGPRTVATFPIPVTSCPDQFPAVQDLPVVCCFDDLSVWAGSSETSGSLSYVNPADYSFWATSGQGSGFSSGPYPNGAGILWKLWASAPSCTVTDISASAVPLTGRTANIQASQAAQAGRSGHSDENSYMLTMSQVSPNFFDGSNSAVVYFGESSGAVPTILSFPCSIKQAWTKYGSTIFQLVHCIGDGIAFIYTWPIPFANNSEGFGVIIIDHGGVPFPGSPIPGLSNIVSVRDMFANANYLYVLVQGAEFTNPKICRIDKTTLTFITSWDITNTDFTSAQSIFVFRDDLIFVLNWNLSFQNTWTIGFLNTNTGVTTTIGQTTATCVQSSNFHASNTVGFQYAKNNFFIGNDGGNVLELGSLVCPSNPLIPWEN